MKGNTWINDYLKLLFNGTAVALVADNAATTPLTNLFAALHTADPGATGNQQTNEAAYGSYARQPVARTAGGFTVSGQSVSLTSLVGFPACTSGGETETHWSIGSVVTGTGKIFYSGVLGNNQGVFTAIASTDILTIPAVSGVAVNDKLSFYATPGVTLPGGITSGTLYFVKTVSGDQITLSTTLGGSTLDITTDGGGLVFKHSPIIVTNSPSVTPQIASGTIITEL